MRTHMRTIGRRIHRAVRELVGWGKNLRPKASSWLESTIQEFRMQSFHAVERMNAHIAMGSDLQVPAPARGLSTDVTAQLGGSDSSPTAWRADIEAAATVPARASDVFAFLAGLANHCLVADRLIEVVMLEGPPGARTGGIVRLRGPIGLRRTARLRVLTAEAPRYINGAAEIGERTGPPFALAQERL